MCPPLRYVLIPLTAWQDSDSNRLEIRRGYLFSIFCNAKVEKQGEDRLSNFLN